MINSIRVLVVAVAAVVVGCGVGAEDGFGAGQSAMVTFDAETGEGFVGKGDVQTAFGWNNKSLQDLAAGVSFIYSTTATFEITCEWTTGPGGKTLHVQEKTKEGSIDAAVAFDARTKNQVTGFFLTGWSGTPTVTGAGVPQVGDQCPENEGVGVDKRVTVVELIGSESVGGLYVTHGGLTVLLNQ